MKNSFGNAVSLTLYGESHGECIGAVLDGVSPGVPVDEEYIAKALSRRRPSSFTDTARVERDDFSIRSGVFNGKTTGAPICVEIKNENVSSGDYVYGAARPSHADYAAYKKYHGFEDYRGGGHFSGRLTAALTAAAGILTPALSRLGVTFATHILRCGAACDREFEDVRADIEALNGKTFPMLDDGKSEAVLKEIFMARENLDSVGGVTQSAVSGLPAGLGEPWFDSVEGLLSHALFSVGGIKGVEFGGGFAKVTRRGSGFNDEPEFVNDGVVFATNNNGGVNGGITNGMPVVFQCAVKPTPSIAKEQKTIDFIKRENIKIKIKGRHDPAIIRRVCPVIDAVTALVVCDLLTSRYGADVLREGF